MSERPKRRWFQFSLRTLFVVMTLLAIVVGRAEYRADTQKLAVEMLQRNEVVVLYDYQRRPGSTLANSSAQPVTSPWLRSVFGDDYFRSVFRIEAVAQRPNRMADVDWRRVGALDSTEVLCLVSVPIRDESFGHLRGLTNLTELTCIGTELTNEGLTTIANFHRLTTLTLSSRNKDSSITDAGLKSINNLTQLERLHLTDTRISNAGLVHLQALTKLKDLGLGSAAITDAGLEQLRPLTALARLDLSGTSVTQEGVRVLATFPALQHVRIKQQTYDKQRLADLRQEIAEEAAIESSP